MKHLKDNNKHKTMFKNFQKNILGWKIDENNLKSKSNYCSGMGSRACLSCDKCWVIEN